MNWSSHAALREAFGGLDHFTDRALDAMSAAWNEADSRQHTQISAEHVLHALAVIGGNVARAALKSFDINLHNERAALETLLEALPVRERGEQFVPRCPAVEQFLQLGKEQSAALGHNYVGTEHLLLAILVGANSAADFLVRRGVTSEAFRTEVLRLLGGR